MMKFASLELESKFALKSSLFIKFLYSKKATKFGEIFPLLLTECTVVKSKGKISQNFVAFLEYKNFIPCPYFLIWPPFRDKYFRSILVQIKTWIFSSEIYWPLECIWSHLVTTWEQMLRSSSYTHHHNAWLELD